MARTVRNAKLDSRSARASSKLKTRKSPYWVPISPGFALGYRKAPKGGVWLAKLVKPGVLRQEATLGPADDALDADGVYIFDFSQAQELAREWKKRIEHGIGASARPKTIREALDNYEADLKARSGDIENVTRLRAHLNDRLLDKPVSALTWAELRKWRDGLTNMKASAEASGRAEKLSPATINRTCTVFKAVLNHVATDPEQRISNRQAWEHGLASIPHAEQARNVILAEAVVRRIIAEAHNHSVEFGLLVEVAAVTGARCGQIARLRVADLQANTGEPRLMMPSSRKGKKGVNKPPCPVPIPVDLAKRLHALTGNQPLTTLLLTKPTSGNWRGGPWKDADHDRPFEQIVDRCDLSNWEAIGHPAKVTIYALRHSSIVRQIEANVPLRIIAATHDTSVAMIERHYSRYITDHTDAITRAAMLDTSKADAPACRVVSSYH